MPGLAFDDWGEMQTVPHVLGIAHPTGYPTYILAAWLFELVPLGSVAFRANVLSAVFVAASLGLLVAIARRVGVRSVPAAVAALATGAIGTVWAAATVAEVNPLHLLFSALLLHRALVWEADRRPRHLVLGGLLVGLSIGNHLLTLFVAPFVALFVAWVAQDELRRHPRWAVAALGALALGLAVYAYIPLAALRSPPLAYNHPVTLERFWALVTGQQFEAQYGELFSLGSVEPFLRSLPDLAALAVARATAVVPAVGLLGLVILVRRRRALGLACWGILLVGVYTWAVYLRLEHYLLVPWLLVGLGVAVALDAAAGAVLRRRPRAGPRTAVWVPAAAGALLVLLLVAVNFGSADRSGDRSAQAYVDRLLAALPQDAVILSYWGASTPLWHAQLVEHLRPDVLVVDDTNIGAEGWGTPERRIASVICSRPVFILRSRDTDLEPTQREYVLTPFLSVDVARGTPTAVIAEPVFSVEPIGGCG